MPFAVFRFCATVLPVLYVCSSVLTFATYSKTSEPDVFAGRTVSCFKHPFARSRSRFAKLRISTTHFFKLSGKTAFVSFQLQAIRRSFYNIVRFAFKNSCSSTCPLKIALLALFGILQNCFDRIMVGRCLLFFLFVVQSSRTRRLLWKNYATKKVLFAIWTA